MLEPDYKGPTPAERRTQAQRHLEMLCSFLGERRGVLVMRQVLPWYGKRMAGVRKFLNHANSVRTASELSKSIADFFAS